MPANQTQLRKVVSGPSTIDNYITGYDCVGGTGRFTIASSGVIGVSDSNDVWSDVDWLLSGLASDLQVLFTKLSGTGAPTNTGTWRDCSTSPQCSVSAATGQLKSAQVEVKFRHKTTLAILGTNKLALNVDNTGFGGV